MNSQKKIVVGSAILALLVVSAIGAWGDETPSVEVPVRLLVIDETQGLQANQIEALSDVRATGVAEITKIRTERTNARCRIVWLANPSTGRPLAQYNQGVLAIKDVFRKPEDIRRLDFALATATGDVDLREINARHGAPVPPRYSSEACRSLVLWAWSRTSDQVSFTPEATEAILAAAMDFGQRYHPSIPIVEPADQRLKFARLAAATAARMYSTDSTGEILEVHPSHVAFVRSYLDKIFDSRGMSYLEYSKQQKQGESFPSYCRRVIEDYIKRPEHYYLRDEVRRDKADLFAFKADLWQVAVSLIWHSPSRRLFLLLMGLRRT